MKLSAPQQSTFWVGLALALLGLLAKIHVIEALGRYDFWLAFAGAVVLALGSYVKGL